MPESNIKSLGQAVYQLNCSVKNKPFYIYLRKELYIKSGSYLMTSVVKESRFSMLMNSILLSPIPPTT